MTKKDVLRETDADAIRQARGLIRTARFGALACLDPETGHPMASRVALATDLAGNPVILISQLSGHFAALEGDARASLLVGEPGKGDPLAHPRITLTCQAARLEGDDRLAARDRYLRRNPKAALYADFGDFAFWRLTLTGASLNGGFGKAYALTAADLSTLVPDGLQDLEPEAVAHMNIDHGDAVQAYAAACAESPGKWTLTGLDADGLDMTHADRVARLWFDPPLSQTREVRPRLIQLAREARAIDP